MRLKLFFISLLLVLILFLRYYQAARPKTGPGYLGYYNNQELSLVGQVVAPPEQSFTYQKLTVGNVIVERRGAGEVKPVRVQGKILVKARPYSKFDYGTFLELQGRLKEPPVFEDFSYKEYLAIDGVYALMNYPKITTAAPRVPQFSGEFSQKMPWLNVVVKMKSFKIAAYAAIYQFRKRVEGLLSSFLPEPQASLMMGIVFGIKKAYLPEVYEALRRAGVLHVIVASGFNISVVIGVLMVLKGLFGPKLGSVFILLGIFGYAILAGLGAPIVRAAILGVVAVLVGLSGRQQQTLWWLFLTAYIMLMINPLWIKSLSFQLSFLASSAILVVKPGLETYFEKMLADIRPSAKKNLWQKVPVQIKDDFLTTASVLLLTTPLVWWNFGQVSWVALVVNSLVLWTIPPLMFLGMGLVVVGLVSTRLAHLLVYPIWALLSYFMWVVQVFT